MGTQYDLEKPQTPIILREPRDILLKDIMVALKQTRTELNKLVRLQTIQLRSSGVEVPHGLDRS